MKRKVKFEFDEQGDATSSLDDGYVTPTDVVELLATNRVEIEITKLPPGWTGINPEMVHPVRIRTLTSRGTGRFGTVVGGGLIPMGMVDIEVVKGVSVGTKDEYQAVDDGSELGYLVRWDDDESESWVLMCKVEPAVSSQHVMLMKIRIRTMPPNGLGRFGTVLESGPLPIKEDTPPSFEGELGYLVRWDDDESETWIARNECEEVKP